MQTVSICILDEKNGLWNEALAFISAEYKDKFGTDPGAPSQLIVARIGNVLVGSIAIEFEDENGTFPVLSHYDIPTPTAHRFTSACSIQLGRWIAKEIRIAYILLYAASAYAAHHKRAFQVFEARCGVARILRGYGIEIHPVPNAVLNLHNVPSGDRAYYESHPPDLYYMHAVATKDVLCAKLKATDTQANIRLPEMLEACV